MLHEDALRLLRLSEQRPNEETVVKAYTRMARRYPMTQFPDRHAKLVEAKSTLLCPELEFKAILNDNRLDLGWLLSSTESPLQPSMENKSKSDSCSLYFNPKQLLEDLTRPLSEDEHFYEDELDDIPFGFDIDEHVVRKMLELMGLRH